MKYLAPILLLVLFVGGCALDKKATRQLYWNVNKVTTENDGFINDADMADSVKDAKHLRNSSTRIQAWEMAKTAGNDEEAPEVTGGIGPKPAPYVLEDPADDPVDEPEPVDPE